MFRQVSVFVMAAALAACSAKPADPEAEEMRLMQASRDWSKAAEAGDMDAVLKQFADDAVMLADGQPPVRGKAAIGRHLAENGKIPGFKIRWEPVEAHVSGGMGYMLERTFLTMPGPGGVPVEQTLQAVTIWRKQADGSWKNVVDASMTSPPPTVAEPPVR